MWDHPGNTGDRTMSNRTLEIDDRTYRYLVEHSLRETPVMGELRALTLEHDMARMQIAPEQGQFMALMAELLGAKQAIEIGTFTGYSALCLAQAMPADSRLICCDISKEWTDVARPYWTRAGVSERIELRIAPALETLDALIREGETDRFDLAFIDADKGGYLGYYERCLKLLRPGGLVMLDNTLWGGSVADPSDQEEDTVALRELNDRLHQDPRVSISLVPIGDGLTLARKR
jgi:predicted O-methyltransferase YrrM